MNPRAILPNLSREEELILCCARVDFNSQDRARFQKLLSESLGWNRVAELARLHRLRPLLFKHFKAEHAEKFVPIEHWAAMQKHATLTLTRNLTQTTELIKILKLFYDANIQAIPFKGPVLGLKTYRNLALREFFDMDLLLHREDILKAKKVLLENGFASPTKQNEQWEQQHIDNQLGCDFTSADGKVRLELHWSFIQKWLSYNVDLEAIWRRAQPRMFAGYPIRSLAPEDLLLYLCAHGAKHHWERLFWITDIAEILRNEPLDWNELLERTREQGSWRLFALGLYLAKNLLDASLPDNVWESIQKESAIPPLARQVGAWLFNEENRVVSGDWNETKFYLGVKERFADRCAYSKHMLKLLLAPSDSDRAYVKLPPSLAFLYPIVRPIRWLTKQKNQ